MKQKRYLYLMRHGQAEDGIVRDFERALTSLGQRQVLAQRAQFKKPIGIRPDIILCSTAKRTKETAQILENLFKGVPVFYRETLYLAPAHRLIDLIRETDDLFLRILIIGHNPGLEQTVGLLSNNAALVPLKPADCVVMKMDVGAWAEIKAGAGQIEKIFLGDT